MRIEDIITALHQEKNRRALEYLTTPSRRDAFEYGERIGIVTGLSIAQDIINKLLHEEDERGKIKR